MTANGAAKSEREQPAEEPSILAPADLPNVRIVRFEGLRRFHSYYNEVYSIATLFRTESEVSFRGKGLQGTSGTVGLMEPDGIFRHIKIPVREFVGKLHIDPRIIENAARELGVRNGSVRFRRLFVHSAPLFGALAGLHDCVQRDYTTLELQSRFATCLRLLIQQSVDGPPALRAGRERRGVRKARDLLHARFAERVTLDELVQASGISAYHLPRIFNRDLGLPPHAYQTHLRLAHARRLLAQGVPMSKVAIDVGFTDQSHLTRHFRRTLGFTPGAYAAGDGDRRNTTPTESKGKQPS